MFVDAAIREGLAGDYVICWVSDDNLSDGGGGRGLWYCRVCSVKREDAVVVGENSRLLVVGDKRTGWERASRKGLDAGYWMLDAFEGGRGTMGYGPA